MGDEVTSGCRNEAVFAKLAVQCVEAGFWLHLRQPLRILAILVDAGHAIAFACKRVRGGMVPGLLVKV
jgi:hypothetical protein